MIWAKSALAQALGIVLNGLDFLANTQPDTYGETSKLVEEIATRIIAAERK